MPHTSTISPSPLPPVSKQNSLMARQRSLLVAVPKSRMSRPMEMEAIQTAVLALTQQQPNAGEKDVAKVIKKVLSLPINSHGIMLLKCGTFQKIC
jgi:hypothetical protein